MKELNMELTGNDRFDTIYINCRNRVLKTAMYYTKRKDIAEEIMQEAFVELFLNINEVSDEKAENWLLKVAKNKAVNWSERSVKEIEKIKILEEHSEERIGRDVEEKFTAKELNRNLSDLSREIFSELRKENENWYEVIRRVYGMEKPQKEVAVEMNMSIEVLHATLYRARKWIKRKYGEQYAAMHGAE